MKYDALIFGMLVGVLVARALPNPFFWIEEKWHSYQYDKRTKKYFEDLKRYGLSEKSARSISGWTK